MHADNNNYLFTTTPEPYLTVDIKDSAAKCWD